MKTIGSRNEIPKECRGLLYLCEYDPYLPELKITGEIAFKSQGEAFEAYANILNPASQLAIGSTQEEFEKKRTRIFT